MEKVASSPLHLLGAENRKTGTVGATCNLQEPSVTQQCSWDKVDAPVSQARLAQGDYSSPYRAEPSVVCEEVILKLVAMCNGKPEKVTELVSDTQSTPLQTSTPEYSHEELYCECGGDTDLYSECVGDGGDTDTSPNTKDTRTATAPTVPAYQIPLKDRTFRDTSQSFLYPPPPPPSPGTAMKNKQADASSPLECEDVLLPPGPADGDDPLMCSEDPALSVSDPLYIEPCGDEVWAAGLVPPDDSVNPSNGPSAPANTVPLPASTLDGATPTSPTVPPLYSQPTTQPSYPTQCYPAQILPQPVQSQPSQALIEGRNDNIHDPAMLMGPYPTGFGGSRRQCRRRMGGPYTTRRTMNCCIFSLVCSILWLATGSLMMVMVFLVGVFM